MSPTIHEMQAGRECLRAHFCAPMGRPLPAGPVAAGRECLAFRLWVDGLAEQGNEALLQLPDKYRFPLVLCYLEGKTNEAAAHELGWPAGSMSRRLARGRELLRQRLLRRGVMSCYRPAPDDACGDVRLLSQPEAKQCPSHAMSRQSAPPR